MNSVRVNVEAVGQLCITFGKPESARMASQEIVPEGTTVTALLESIAFRCPGFAELAFMPGTRELNGSVGVILNGALVTTSSEYGHKLKEGDSVVLVPLLVGG